MLNLDEHKQLVALVCDEVNIKNYLWRIGKDENDIEIGLIYNREANDFFIKHGDDLKPISEKNKFKIISFFNK